VDLVGANSLPHMIHVFVFISLLGRPPSLPFSRLDLALTADLIEPSIAAGLISVLHFGHFIFG
jgi:hypothetical protein